MKKLIIISVIFALMAASVFAADISVNVQGSATLLEGSSAKWYDGVNNNGAAQYNTDYNGVGFNIGQVRIGASGATEDGILGGWLRFDGSYGNYLWKDDKGNDQYGIAYVSPSGFVWWKPADIFKLQIGANPDGEFGLDGVSRWGFYQTAGDLGVVKEGWAFGSAFFGGWNAPGIILSSNPVNALSINVGIPLLNTKYPDFEGGDYPKTGDDYAYQNYKNTTIQVVFNIEKVGTAGLTFIGDQANEDPVFGFTLPTAVLPAVIKDVKNDNPKIYAYFGLATSEKFSMDIGIGYKFADKYTDERTTAGNTTKQTFTVNEPLALGVAANLNLGSFGLKARLLTEFLGNLNYDYSYKSTALPANNWSFSETLSTGYTILFDILPYFNINDKLTFYISAGFGTKGGEEDLYYKVDQYGVVETDSDGHEIRTHKTRDSVSTWHLNPYISINYGAGAFFAGFRLVSPYGKDGDDNAYVNWSIPIGISIGF